MTYFDMFCFVVIDCKNITLVGNGICNDDTNIIECNYDGGDCCGSCIVKTHCLVCLCLQNHTDSNPLIGNGYCNDDTNNAECHYDGGDCCGTCIVKDHCIICDCLLRNEERSVFDYFFVLLSCDK